ncbi:MAG: Ti-type conjugative transfer relaxase TraA [Burkholderiaceae bacterium]|nr:Ti-type conjugative transfer relaxase TraA [Burkholderiaceae bacterium]
MSRSSGRSSVAAAAYRAADKLENQRDGLVHDFSRRSGVEHAEIVLPKSVEAEWAKDRLALWNLAEVSEKRKDARVAREIEVALPHELSAEQRLDLTREFAQELADRYGVAVDFAIHSPHGDTDIRNHHVHLMMTTRKIRFDGLGEKSELELENKRLQALGLPTSHDQLRALRIDWEEKTNDHLAHAGLEIRIDHRSHQARGLEIEPTQHMGVHATQMDRRGKAVSRVRIDEQAASRNAELILEKPEQVLMLITNEKSVFDRHDVARTLHRYIGEPEAFQAAFAKVMGSPALVELLSEQRDEGGLTVVQARYSTREMVDIEGAMAKSADRMTQSLGGFGVAGKKVEAAIGARPFLAGEQRAAIEHVTGPERIAAVVGLAGAGKSTMLAAAREAWEAEGYRVHGAALSGKAAEGLEESAGIASRTLASWDRGWERGFDALGPRDVFVIDEAGMVGSRQLSRFIQEADRAGAKIVLVGDPEQLQPIGPGAAFRAVAERVGFVELEDIRRQREDWQRAASVDFGRHRTDKGLAAYAEQGAVRLEDTVEQARAAIVRDVASDMATRPDGSRLVLAHRNADVRALNEAIRAVRKEQGELEGERVYRVLEGERSFARGDRVLFRENNRELGVKNGMLATVERAEDGRLGVRLDSAQGLGRGRAVEVSMEDYAAIDHGYATTIHKAQGATVDRVYVLASGTMDRHLTYVAMTRHREDVQLYAGRDEFSDMSALSARLSRSQTKETTLDYDRSAYAERRGIELQSEIRVPAVKHERKRSLFDGLKLNTGRVMQREAQRDAWASVRMRVQERAPEPGQQEAPSLTRAVDRYARAWTDAARMRSQALPVLEYQKMALHEAGAALETVQMGATRDLLNALKYEPATYKAMTQQQGRERAAQLVAGIEHEARVRQDPNLKVERLVKVWNALEAERDRLRSLSQAEALGKVEARMQSIAGELKGDPQLELVMRSRQGELGIVPGSGLDRVINKRNIEPHIRRERGRGMER